MKRLVIVGNGPSALSKENGEFIDSCDIVVRMNDFLISGYEKFVGSKTDILFTCRLNEYNSLEKIAVFQEVIISLLMNPLEGIYIEEEVLNAKNIKDRLYENYAEEVGRKIGLKKPEYPSTGVIAIYYFLQHSEYDDYNIYITGFDHFTNGNKHYYQEGDRKYPPLHNAELEREFVRSLCKMKQLYRL